MEASEPNWNPAASHKEVEAADSGLAANRARY